MSANPFYDPETEGDVYHVVPTHTAESISDIVSETESSASGMTIWSEELDEYFMEHHGRQHPASENAIRWLPLDNVKRDILRHVVEKYVYGNNYLGPVRQMLFSDPRAGKPEPRRVLEIGTRSGTWIQEMAAEFPHVQFQTVDVAPLTAHVPRSNIVFEVYDISEGLLLPDDSQDIVFVNNGLELILNYQKILLEAHRVLRPGGLIHIRELGPGVWDPEDDSKPALATNPRACHLFDLVRTATIKYGADPDARSKIPQWLAPDSELWSASGRPRGFEQIHTIVKLHRPYPHPGYACSSEMHPHMIPLLGHLYAMCVRDAVGLLCDGGLNAEEAKSLTEEVVEELKDPQRCPILKMYIMYAIKRRSDSA